MFEAIALVVLAKLLGALCEKNGQSTLIWVCLLVVLWLAGECGGLWLGMGLASQQGTGRSLVRIYMFGLGGALLFASFPFILVIGISLFNTFLYWASGGSGKRADDGFDYKKWNRDRKKRKKRRWKKAELEDEDEDN